MRQLVDEPARRAQLRGRLWAPWRQRRFGAFGAHSIVDRPTWIYRPHLIAIGARTVILRGAWLAVEKPAWDRDAPVIVIGDGVWMRPGCTVSASAGVVIEDDVVLAGGCTVVDSDHQHRHGDRAGGPRSVLQSASRAEPIRIGRGSWLGEHACVVRGATIGEHCSIGANSVVVGDIPDHSIAVGAPARVVGSTR